MCDVFGLPSFPRPFQKLTVLIRKKDVFVFGSDKVEKKYGVLKINTTNIGDPNVELELYEEERTCTCSMVEMESHLHRIRSDGTFLDEKTGTGIVGFVRFLQGYYLILITKHMKAGKIGHHDIFCIESTITIPLFNDATKKEENNLRDQFPKFDSKDYYFSYSYELSRSVQQNLADAARNVSEPPGGVRRALYTETDPLKHHRFVWNHFHMGPFLKRHSLQRWCLPIIHGFFQNASCASAGWTFEIALIARRSRFYAGTRFRKRGVNVDGHVANDVETEQLLCEDSTRHLSRGHVMSFVQMRGSVPIFWSQEGSMTNPKPSVNYPRCDYTLSATRRHFADLMERYGTKQVVVNLMKARKVDSQKLDSHEARLSKNFESAIERLNRELPSWTRIWYRPFDVKNHAKFNSVGGDSLYSVFRGLAEAVVNKVGFFHTQSGMHGRPEQKQNGIVRTNCLDCLDRTNVLQFAVGLAVLEKQLDALNLLPEKILSKEHESKVPQVLSELYDLMGDHLALQYAGSKVHKKYQLLGVQPRMLSGAVELWTAVTRHYSNTTGDADRQAKVNLQLGIYNLSKHSPLTDGDCDSWVHHRPIRDDYYPGEWWVKPQQTYMENMASLDVVPARLRPLSVDSELFRAVYKPRELTLFDELRLPFNATMVPIAPQLRLPFNATMLPIAPQTSSGGTILSRLLREKCQINEQVPKTIVPLFDPRRMHEADQQIYTDYADLKLLNRWMWISRAEKAQPVSKPILMEPNTQTNTKTAKVSKEGYPTLEILRKDLDRIPTRSTKDGPLATNPGAKHLCTYCHQLFVSSGKCGVAEVDAATNVRSTVVLCPEHRRRVQELRHYCQNGGFWGTEESEKPTRIGSLQILVPRGLTDCKTFQKWVTVDKAVAADAMAARRPAVASRRSPESRHQVVLMSRAGMIGTVGSRSAGDLAAYSHCRSSGESDDGRKQQRTLQQIQYNSGPPRRQSTWAVPPPAPAPATPRPGTVPAVPSGAAQFTFAGEFSGEASISSKDSHLHWKHLWSHAFPLVPTLPTVEEDLGLPAWWLQIAKSKRQSLGSRAIDVKSHLDKDGGCSRVGGLVAKKREKPARKRAAFAQISSPNMKPAIHPLEYGVAVGTKLSRSIFSESLLNRVIDEELRGMEFVMVSSSPMSGLSD